MKLPYRRRPLIGGIESGGNAGERVVVNPFDGSEAGRVYYADDMEVLNAIATASKTLDDVKLTAAERSAILSTASSLICEKKEEFARLIMKEAGKPIRLSRIEVDRAVFTFSAASKAARKFDDPIYPELYGAPNAAGKSVTYRYFPLGVIAAITPFNFPLNLCAHKIAPAIASGNTVIHKPAPQTPLTAYLLADVLTEAGLPAGCLNVVSCENDAAQKLVTDERIAMLTFTGSATVGWKLKSLIPKKPVTLELGGNGAVIIDEVRDMDSLIDKLVVSGFGYAGQVCISMQQLYIRRDHYGSVREGYVEAAKKVVTGDPSAEDCLVGPMISADAAQQAWRWIENAKLQGASMLCGEFREPNVITPVILENVPDTCELSCEEAFAPVVILRCYDTIDEVITQINSSRYGLQTGVFAADDIVTTLYERLEVGGVIAGETNTFRVDTMPYGGVKDSGIGREGVEFAMREMCTIKTLVK